MKLSRPFAALALAATAACSDFATKPDRFPAELRVIPDTLTVTAGEPIAFSLEVLDEGGQPFERVPFWSPPVWRVSDSELASLENGAGTALAPGGTAAIAELAGLSGRAVIQVNPTEVEVSVPAAYMTQVVQREDGTVPLVAGREALLRVFVNGDGPNFFQPAVTAVFTNGGGEVHRAVLELENPGLPQAVDQGDLDLSYDALIPGDVVQPGMTFHVEVDPDGTIPAAAGSVLRFPAAGEFAQEVREVAPFGLRMVPVNHARDSEMTQGLAREVTRFASDVFPLADFDVDVRTPYTTDSDLSGREGWSDLIFEILLLRLDDGSDRYYYGGFRRFSVGGLLGLGYVGYPVSIGDEAQASTIAHEIGHNLSLRHAPCGGPEGVDPAYPHAGGDVGIYGYDRSSGRVTVPGEMVDLMTYCTPDWISDFHYEKALAYRDTSEFDTGFSDSRASASRGDAGPRLLVSGGVLDGELSLRPALSWSGPASVPAATSSDYRVEGLDEAGRVLFDLPVLMRPLDHLDGGMFMVSIPESLARPAELGTLRLTGPEGMVEQRRAAGTADRPEVTVDRATAGFGGSAGTTLRWNSALYPFALVRDETTGQIIAMDRDGELVLPGADPGRVVVELSDGVASREAEVVVR